MMPGATQGAPSVAFFDFDGTLTKSDTLMPFLKYVVGSPTYYTKLALVSPVLAAYLAKILRNDIAKQLVLRHYLANQDIGVLQEKGDRFSHDIVPTMLRPEGMERLRRHQKLGHICVLVSASLDVYLNSWAHNENFEDVICTQLQLDSSKRNGKIIDKNCFGKEKSARIELWKKGKILGETFAYGDTLGDVPMLSSVDHGYMWNRKQGKFVPFT